MKRILALLVVMMFAGLAQAQEITFNETAAGDSLVVRRPAAVDSTLLGHSVYDLINSAATDVKINRSSPVDAAFVEYIEKNSERKLNGYRIRIFFDNKQTARIQSEEIEKSFMESFPQYPVYRTYSNPYFKVAVGDFRTKSDAVKILQIIQSKFPKAFIIKDVINYPL